MPEMIPSLRDAVRRILARRRPIAGFPELVRAIAKEWPRNKVIPGEREVLDDALKHLMRRGAFQDLFGLPEHLLRSEVATIMGMAVAAERAYVEPSPGKGTKH